MKRSKSSIIPVILCGGQSSRLFPFNKVISDLLGSNQSLIQQAYKRGVGLGGASNVHVLTGSSMVPMIQSKIPVPAKRFLSDPVRRGTWPAILWAMAHLRHQSEAVIAILTGDHVIPDQKTFQRLASRAVTLARQQRAMVMLGVKPSSDALVWQGFGCFRVTKRGAISAFEEKPSQAHAKTMIAAGGWLWNSGMFFFRVSTAEEALKHFQPDQFWIYHKLLERLALGDRKGAEQVYAEFPAQITHPLHPERQVDNTIDFAVMTPLVAESASPISALAVPEPLRRWHDIGQWTTLREVCRPDRKGNVVIGRVTLGSDIRQTIVAADRGCRIEANGVQGFVLACSRERALVLPIAELGGIKTLVAESREPVVRKGAESLTISFHAGRLIVGPKANFIRSRP